MSNSPTLSTSASTIIDGEKLFKGNCIVCHGEKPNQAPTLSVKNVNRTVIENGRPEKDMPLWSKVLTPDKITATIEYLKS